MMAQPSSSKPNPIVIKKYANRRLYNTDTSAYVTLDDLCQMIKEGEDLVVYDAKNGDDITRSVLTQIIVEQESKEGGQQLLPTNFLRQLIGFYGNNMQSVVPRYLEYTMQTFTKNQSQMRDYFRSTFGGVFSQTFEEMGKQNMAIFEQAMKMFSPFAGMPGMQGVGGMPGMGSASSSAPSSPQDEPAPEAKASPSSASAGSSSQASATPHLRPVATPPSPAPAAVAPAPASVAAPAPNFVPAAAASAQPGQKSDGSIEQMQNRLDELQKQIASLSKGDETR